jgi:hypothetical protein
MPERRKLRAAAGGGLGLLLLFFLSFAPALGQELAPLREFEGVVIPGSAFPSWVEQVNLKHLNFYVFLGNGQFDPIPFQIDKRRKINLSNTVGSRTGPQPLRGLGASKTERVGWLGVDSEGFDHRWELPWSHLSAHRTPQPSVDLHAFTRGDAARYLNAAKARREPFSVCNAVASSACISRSLSCTLFTIN